MESPHKTWKPNMCVRVCVCVCVCVCERPWTLDKGDLISLNQKSAIEIKVQFLSY